MSISNLAGMVFEIGAKAGFLTLFRDEYPALTINSIDKRFYAPVNNYIKSWYGLPNISSVEKPHFEAQMAYAHAMGFLMGQNLYRSIPKKKKPGHSVEFKQLKADDVQLWCPYPGELVNETPERTGEIEAFIQTFGKPLVSLSLARGEAVNADFILQISKGKRVYRYVCDFSIPWAFLAGIRGIKLEGDPNIYLDKNSLIDTPRIQGRRNAESSPFVNSAREVPSSALNIDERMGEFYVLFQGKEKSFYKLCQCASYLSSFVRSYDPKDDERKHISCLLSVTPYGVEKLGPEYCIDEQNCLSPAVETLANLYRKNVEDREESWEQRKEDAAQNAWRRMSRKLGLRVRSEDLRPKKINRQSVNIDIFSRLQDEDSMEFQGTEVLSGVPRESDGLCFVNPSTRNDEGNTLRDIHAQHLEDAIRIQKPGENMSVVLALAHPGAGKTTCVKNLIAKLPGKTFFFYASPRVNINKEVTQSVVDTEKNTIAITTNEGTIRAFECPKEEDREWDAEIATYNLGINLRKSKGRYPIAYYASDEIREDSPYFTPCGKGVKNIFFVQHGNVDSLKSFVSQKDSHEIAGSYRQYESTRKSYQKTDNKGNRPAILQLLKQGVVSILSKELSESEERIDTLCAISTLQAFRGRKASSNMQELIGEATEALSRNVSKASIQERGNVVLMVDEITGASEGKGLMKAMVNKVRELAEHYPHINFHVVIADASLVNHDVAKLWYQSDPELLPACLIGKADALVEPGIDKAVQSGCTKLSAGLSVNYVEANAYPAGRLTIDYRFSLVKKSPLSANAEEINSGMSSSTMEQFLSRTVVEALREEGEDGGQVLLFLQGKNSLENIKKNVLEEISDKEILTLTAESRPKKDETQKSHYRLIVMTSAGSRGINCPHVTTYVVGVNTFAPEETLMEVQQGLFRGRGGGKDNLDRKIIFCVTSSMSPEQIYSKTETSFYFYKKCFEMASALLMLRSTLFSRALGRSGLRGRQDAERGDIVYCPVGSVQPQDHQKESMLALAARAQKAMREMKDANIGVAKELTFLNDHFSRISSANDLQLRELNSQKFRKWYEPSLCGYVSDKESSDRLKRDRMELAERFSLSHPSILKNARASDGAIEDPALLYQDQDRAEGVFFVGTAIVLFKNSSSSVRAMILNIGDHERRQKFLSYISVIRKAIKEKHITDKGKPSKDKHNYGEWESAMRSLYQFYNVKGADSDGSAPKVEHEVEQEIQSAAVVVPFAPLPAITRPGESDYISSEWPQILCRAANIDTRQDNIWPNFKLKANKHHAWACAINHYAFRDFNSLSIGKCSRVFNLLALLVKDDGKH